MSRECALITGASSGIGLELARLFAADGCDVILGARNRDRLDALAGELSDGYGIEATVIPADLADPAAPRAVFDAVAAAGRTVDVLVNDAGFALNGPACELDEQRQADMVQVNVMALTRLTRLFLPHMVARDRGGVLNLGSMAGFVPGPYMTVYYATKAYVMSFTEGLAGELHDTGVTVTLLAPGPTESGFQATASIEDKPVTRMGLADAHTVARMGYEGFRAGRLFVVPGIGNKVGAASVRFAPRAVVRTVVAALQK